jgi:potassium-dependent mechanosensitive channel
MLQRLLQYLGLRFRQYLLTIIAQNNEKEETDLSSSMALNLFLNLAFLLLKIILWLSTLLYIANLFPFSRQWSYVIYHTLISSFSTPLVSIGDQKYSVVDFLILFALFFALLIGASAVTNFLRSRILQFTGIGKGTQAAIAIVSKYTILSIGTIVLLQVWGLDLSSLTIFASAIGVAIGFGFQDIAKNFASGLILLFERPIQVGDFIEVGNFLGTVEHIGARSTLIRTLDHISIIVPNSRFLENEVINWSHLNPISRLHLPVGLAYGSDVLLVQKALLEVAQDYSKVLVKPSPQVLFKGFGDNALEFELLVWISEPNEQPSIKSSLYFRIEACLRKYHLEVPFPQRDLYLKKGEVSLTLSPEVGKQLNQIQQLNQDLES